MYRVTYSSNLKPLTGSHSSAIVKRGDGWYVVDPMRFERYRAQNEVKQERRAVVQEKRAEASRSYLFQPAKPQVKTRAPQAKKQAAGGKRTMHSKRRFMSASIMADTPDTIPPTTGELIQPLRGREWVSEFFVPLAQAGITGILVAGGAGIVLAISHELLDTVRAGLLEFGVIGGAAWLWGIARRARDYDFLDAITEALPLGALAGIGTAVYYLTVTGSWFTFWWGAALAGVAGFAGLAFQWARFMGKSDDLLYAIERMMAVDLDGDGDVGEPPVEPNGVRSIPVNRGDNQEAVEVDNALPVDSHVWQSFAVAVLAHKCNISKNAICKLTSEPGWKWRKISQPAYSAIYRYCEKNKYIETDSVTGSNALSGRGWEELSRWLPRNISPNLPHPAQEVS